MEATPGEARTRWRRHTQTGGSPDLRLGLAANFTLEPLIPLLGAALLERGFTPVFQLGPYNQLLQVCLDPCAHLGQCDAIVLAWRLDDFLGDELMAALRGEAGAPARCVEKSALFTDAIAGLRANFEGSIVVSVPPLPCTLPAGPLELGSSTAFAALHRAILTAIAERLAPLTGVALWDLDSLQRQFGAGVAVDFRQWYLYHQPFSDRFLLAAAEQLARVITAQRRASRKCIVLDGDNTLWGGIIGEDGVAGVQIGGEFPGSAYRDFQQLLLHWRAQGILLALSSKNNEADVWELFETHSGMALQRSDFVSWRINWETKPENIAAIARELNLGLEGLVFIDDNAFEIEAVRRALPAVLCVPLPDDPADLLPAMRALTCFDRLQITAEDRARTAMMHAEQQRQDFGGRVHKEEFLQSIGLHLRFFAAAPTDLERITQLINKTNQFNLTTRRRTLDEVRALAASPAHRLYGVQISDRFGAYGLTGVVIVERLPQARQWALDTFLLSCRVLGRGVETALLSALGAEAHSEGVLELTASFIPSAKNAPAAGFLPGHGFRQLDDGTWLLAVSAVPAANPAITLTT